MSDASFPTGSTTFLVADIEGSIALREKDALAEHDKDQGPRARC